MTIALMTDIHANREAFEACLAHAAERGAAQFVFLGDFVGYGADPEWVLDTLIEHVERGATALMGNHDAAALGRLPGQLNTGAQHCIEWTRPRLSPKHLDFLARLPLAFEDGPYLYVHANGWDPGGFEYVFGSSEAGRSMRVAHARITFCGHMHEPMLYHMGLTQRVETFSPIPGSSIPLSAARRWLALPGSVGQPRDGDPAACYATFDELTSLLTFWRVPYDHEQAARKVLEAGLPPHLATLLMTGGAQ
ncbi:MAG TPA: metallophosphoesterase family protein [Burkholderiaceae bacterium]|jgi:diadenosine tetraphosphatase ApaH/serine/threonine PP2A family protein phosphatase|nr:metallophosphoesterase family protein [Burkholderiaceae bacterium]